MTDSYNVGFIGMSLAPNVPDGPNCCVLIGIGNMGYGMATNVRKKMPTSAVLSIYDVNLGACQRFVDELNGFGPVEIASSPRTLADRSMIVLSMLPMDTHAREVYLNPEYGIIASPPNTQRLALECSTLSVTASQAIGDSIREAGAAYFVDTPVSGGVQGAKSGKLSFFCGTRGSDEGPEAEMTKRITTILGYMGDAARINFCGSFGSGLTCKIVNNYIAMSNLAVPSEALAFGVHRNIDIKVLKRCIEGSSGDSWMIRNSPPAPGMLDSSPSSNGFRAGFATRLCIKNMNLAIAVAKSVGIATRVGDAALAKYLKAEEDPQTTVSPSDLLQAIALPY